MQQEIVAVALEIVADEFQIVAVGDVANSLGEERLVGFDLFEADRTLLARDLGDAGQFVDQVARRQAAQGEGEFGAERQAMEHRRQRKPDQRRGERAAEDDDDGMDVVEHVEVAAHQDQRRQYDHAGDEAKQGRDIHHVLRRVRTRPAVLDGDAAHSGAAQQAPYVAAIKDA